MKLKDDIYNKYLFSGTGRITGECNCCKKRVGDWVLAHTEIARSHYFCESCIVTSLRERDRRITHSIESLAVDFAPNI